MVALGAMLRAKIHPFAELKERIDEVSNAGLLARELVSTRRKAGTHS